MITPLIVIIVTVLEIMVWLGISTVVTLIGGPPGADATDVSMALVLIAIIVCASGVGLILAVPSLIISLILRVVFPHSFIDFHYALGLIKDA
jgi:hypothetical protein